MKSPTRSTYAILSAFRLAARALANVYGAPADLKATLAPVAHRDREQAHRPIRLDPIGVAQADAAPVESEPDDLDGFDRPGGRR